MTDVIIAGGGPVGVMLAAELRLHGVDVLVLEKDSEPTQRPGAPGLFLRHSGAPGLSVRSTEVRDERGVPEPFLALVQQSPALRFAGGAQPAPDRLDTAHA